VSKGNALTRMSEPALRAWILARVRGEREEPPIAEDRLESPDDYVQLVHQQTSDAKLRARIEKASLAALRETASKKLRKGRDAQAIQHLAALVNGLGLRDAAPTLLEIAERGALGGHDGGVDPDAEEMVLFALAELQAPKVLWPRWYAAWQQEIPRLWPVVTSGLRLSDPKKALAILPTVVDRAAKHADFPLGEVLWAYATDEKHRAEDFAAALKGLSPAALARCREALESVGASSEELDAWIPSPPSQVWWKRPGLHSTAPPRLEEVA
jgi:hypothetical protein